MVASSSLATGLILWLGPLAIILGSFWTQILVAQSHLGTAGSLSLRESLSIEIAAFWLFDSLRG